MKNDKIKSFKVLTQDGQALGGDQKTEIDKAFKYVSILSQSISDIRVEFYGEDGKVIEKGRLIESSGVVTREENNT
jgi:hypothetical protein